MNRYWSGKTRELEPYVPGEQPQIDNLVKLNTNENPYGPSPAVLQAIQEQVGEGLRLYPDPNCLRLKEAVAGFYGLKSDRVFVGNGSDEVLAHAFQALLQQSRPILCPDISYSFYPVYCTLYGVERVAVPLSEDFAIDVEDYLRPNGGILFANPNAPTGRLLELDKIDWLLAKNRDSVVLVDEAYVDFGGESAIPLVEKYDNLLIAQTMSKSRSLAGLRIGFAVGSPGLVEALERVKNSFNSYPLDRLAIAAGAAAMADRAYFETTRDRIVASREWLAGELGARGFEVIPSRANFVFARKEGWPGADLFAALRRRNILVRHFDQPRISEYLRISVGTGEECGKLVGALDQIFAEEYPSV